VTRSGKAERIALATSVIDAFSAGDWDRLRAALADDLEFRASGTAAEFHGADALIAHLQNIRAGLPDIRCEIVESTTSGSLVILGIKWTGTHSGTLQTPFGDISPSGRVVHTTSQWMLRIDRGRVTGIRALDSLGLLGQFGRPD
jgi:ketosteroid isomerase-like protein